MASPATRLIEICFALAAFISAGRHRDRRSAKPLYSAEEIVAQTEEANDRRHEGNCPIPDPESNRVTFRGLETPKQVANLDPL